MKSRMFVFLLSVAFTLFCNSTFIFAQTTGKYIYVGNPNYPYNHISVVNVETNTIVKTIGNINKSQKIYISPDGLQAYVLSTNYSSRRIAVIDTSVHEIANSSLVTAVRSVAFSPDSKEVFIGTNNSYQAWNGGDCRFGGGLQLYDTTTFDHIYCFDTEEYGPWVASVRPDGKYAYTVSYYNTRSSLRAINLESYAYPEIVKTFARRIEDMAQDPSGKYLYVLGRFYWYNDPNENFGYLFTVDMDTNVLVHELKVPFSQFNDLGISPDGQYACIIDSLSNQLYIVDLQDYSYRTAAFGEKIYDVINRIPNLIFSPDSSYVYLLGLETFNITKVDLFNANIVDSIALDKKPYQLIMTPDGKYFYVSIPSSHIVSVFDVSTKQKIKDIGGFYYPSPIAFVQSDNEGPNVYDVFAGPVQISNSVTVTATVDETETGELAIDSAKCILDGAFAGDMEATDGFFDDITEDVTAELIAPDAPRIYEICVTGTDSSGNEGDPACAFLPVYDPSGGFVTGGGWINSPEGAYTADPSLTGKANFGFVSKYKKGATEPTGETEFQFKVADLNFHSDTYDWLVIAGPKAMYKGTGTINGTGNYGFMLSAIDEKLTPSTDVDLFRIKIWNKDNGDAVVYDNQIGAEEDADPATEIGGGSIVIHKPK